MKHRKTILIVDDQELNRAILSEFFKNEYKIEEADDGESAIKKIKELNGEIAALLLDIKMPGVDGFGVLKYLDENQLIHKIPVFLITADTSPDVAMRGYENGVVDVISKPIEDPLIVIKRVNNAVELYESRRNLEALAAKQINTIKEQTKKLRSISTSMIDALSSVIEFRSGESGEHVRRIRKATRLMLEKIKDEYHIDDKKVDLISNASSMHDIGKISVPDSILNKPGRLTKEEFEEIKKHTLYGCQLLESIVFFKNEEIYPYCYEICRYHHERWDGKGYPDGLKGNEIPIWAQIVSIVDVYDALVSKRVYKNAFSREKAKEMIFNGECGSFNPKLLKVFEDTEEEIYENLFQNVSSLFEEEEEEVETVQVSAAAEKFSNRTVWLLEQERQKYQWLSEISGEILFDFDRETDTVTYTEKFQEVFQDRLKFDNASDYMLNSDSIADQGQLEEIMKMISGLTPQNPVGKGEMELYINDGSRQWYEIYIKSLWGNDPIECIGYIGKLSNIDDHKKETIKWQKQALHDYLTGVYNSKAMKQMVKEILQKKQESAFAMLFFDVDNFKLVNDTLGHLTGDELLKKLAVNVQKKLRTTDILARIGGDEFAVLLRGVHQTSIMERKAKEICGIFSTDEFDDYHCDVSCSVGIARYPEDGNSYEELMGKADKALYVSKKKGKNTYSFYDEETMGTEASPTMVSDMDSETKKPSK